MLSRAHIIAIQCRLLPVFSCDPFDCRYDPMPLDWLTACVTHCFSISSIAHSTSHLAHTSQSIFTTFCHSSVIHAIQRTYDFYLYVYMFKLTIPIHLSTTSSIPQFSFDHDFPSACTPAFVSVFIRLALPYTLLFIYMYHISATYHAILHILQYTLSYVSLNLPL